MKKSVIDIYDLQEIAPVFKGKAGTVIGKWLLKIFAMESVNKIHARHCHKRGTAFTTALLNDPLINLKYNVHNEEVLDSLPEGAFTTVSNHPIGSLDGIILIDIFARRRPDFKVMVNGVLTRIGAMEDNFISVVPDTVSQGTNSANINGVRLSLQQLKDGHPVGFFPAGAISFYDSKIKGVKDLPWAHSVIKLIRKAQVPIVPVYFDFRNTRFFYFLGRIDWRIRTLRLPAEAFNKKGKTVDVWIGEPISVEQISEIEDDEQLASFLYKHTYSIKVKPNH